MGDLKRKKYRLNTESEKAARLNPPSCLPLLPHPSLMGSSKERRINHGLFCEELRCTVCLKR
jgi:hypothetical protein